MNWENTNIHQWQKSPSKILPKKQNQLKPEEIFSSNFIAKFNHQENRLAEKRQELKELQEDIKNFINPAQEIDQVNSAINELMEFFKRAVSNQEYSQYLQTETASDIVRNLQAFEKNPPRDPHFRYALENLQLDKYENLIRKFEKLDKQSSNLIAVPQLFSANDVKDKHARKDFSPQETTLHPGELQEFFGGDFESSNPQRHRNSDTICFMDEN